MLLLLLLLPAPTPTLTPSLTLTLTLTLTPAIRCPRIPPLHLSVIWVSVADSIKLLNLPHTSRSEYPVGIPPVDDELQERVRITNGPLRAGNDGAIEKIGGVKNHEKFVVNAFWGVYF